MSSQDELRRPPAGGGGPGGGDGTGKISVPNDVLIAFWAWIATAVLSLVDLALHMPDRQRLLATARRMDTDGLTAHQIDLVVNVAVIASVVISVVVALLYVLFAWKMRGGRNWARVVLTLITLFELVVALGAGGGGWVALAIGCLAIVAMYLPTSNRYFAAVAARRAGGRGQGTPGR